MKNCPLSEGDYPEEVPRSAYGVKHPKSTVRGECNLVSWYIYSDRIPTGCVLRIVKWNQKDFTLILNFISNLICVQFNHGPIHRKLINLYVHPKIYITRLVQRCWKLRRYRDNSPPPPDRHVDATWWFR